jgi:hypothetical protein
MSSQLTYVAKQKRIPKSYHNLLKRLLQLKSSHIDQVFHPPDTDKAGQRRGKQPMKEVEVEVKKQLGFREAAIDL